MESYIGCSGWQYKDWKNSFYPEKLNIKKWLQYYSEHFKSVEVNGTFYGSIRQETFKKWYQETPKDFIFSIKGHRYVTHMKKLNNVEDAVKRFYDQISPLEEKIGCILWQLPKSLQYNIKKLEYFCAILDKKKTNALEFRNEDWFCNDVYNLLKQYNIAFCSVSAPQLPREVIKTADFLYLRFHGLHKWYQGNYPLKELKFWIQKITNLHPQKIFCYFDNTDKEAFAAKNAKTFAGLIHKFIDNNKNNRSSD